MTRDAERQPPRPPGLVRLPPRVRRCIYLYTGLARFDGLPYTYYLDGRKESHVTSDSDAPHARNFAGLLLSCRTLHDEAAALLYSANRFVIFYSDQGSLGPLRALSPTAIASLASLKVVLNQAACHGPVDSHLYPPSCCRGRGEDGLWASGYHCARYHDGLHRRPLNPTLNSDLMSTMMSEWRDTAAYVSSHVGVGRLEFSLVCDIEPADENDTLETARLAVAPLALFPLLKDCHVWFSRLRNRPLQRLAEEAALQARGTATPLSRGPAMTSPLTRLPREVRLRILEYTDLITPWREVTWSRQHRDYQVCRPPCRFRRELECPPHIHNGCRLSRCGPDDDGADVQSPGCFCRRRHAAFSVTCNCWLPPTDLFLICRILCRDAQFVFFSRNRFVVHDFHATKPCDLPDVQLESWEPGVADTRYGLERYYPYERFAVSEFLRDIVPVHCLADLRFVELVFPPNLAHGWPREKHAPVQEWRATTKWIRGKVNAPALGIRFVMAPFSSQIEGHRAMTEEQGAEIGRGFMRIMHHLRRSVREDGLAGFYVQAASPWRWTEKSVHHVQHHGSWGLDKVEREMGERCERGILGRDPSLTPSKPEPAKSVWQRQYEVWSKSWSYH